MAARITGPVIELRGLARTYPGPPPVPALRPAHLVIEAGDYVAVTGPSGSGKSTLLHLFGLLDAPTEGSYLLDGLDTSTLPAGPSTSATGCCPSAPVPVTLGPVMRRAPTDLPRPRLAARDAAAEAVAGIVQRPGRAVLTMLGTVLGVGAFVAVLGMTATGPARSRTSSPCCRTPR